MEKLKIFFDVQKTQSASYSFNNFKDIPTPITVDVSYSINTLNDAFSYLLVESVGLKEKKFSANLIKIGFLFYIKNYSTYTFIKNQKFRFFRNNFDLHKQLQSIPNPKRLKTLFCACILKKVKGGYILDLNGYICFMPYSLSEGNRFALYEPELNTVQLFRPHNLSLVSFFNKEVFLSLIASRNTALLKKTLKFFIGYNFNNRIFLIRKKINLKVKNKTIRLLGFGLRDKYSIRLKLIKEAFHPDVNN